MEPLDDGGHGRIYWAMGFSPFVPIIGGLAIIILPIVLADKSRNHPDPLVRENAKSAANWHLTAALVVGGTASVTFSLAALSFLLDIPSLFEIAIAGILLTWLLGLIHFVVTIVGIVRSRAIVFRPKPSIPFFR